MDPITVNLTEARRITGLSNTSLYKKINDGTLETTHVGKRILITYKSLLDMLSAGRSLPRDTRPNWKPPVPGRRAQEATPAPRRMMRRRAPAQ